MKNAYGFTRNASAAVAGSMLTIIGCATPVGSPNADDAAMTQAFESYKAAWNGHDVEALTAFYADGGTYSNPGTGVISGEALAQWLGGLFTAIPDFKVRPVSADWVDADSLAEQWVMTGTWTEPFPGGPLAGAKPSGKSFEVPGASFIDWSGEHIVTDNTYFDQMAFLTQIGLIPPPEESPRASAR